MIVNALAALALTLAVAPPLARASLYLAPGLDGTPHTSRVRGEAKRVGTCENG